MKTDDFRVLLDSFRDVPTEERPPTFMEIEGYPHYENVCSNILAFYLDPSRQHGLGGLLLECLLRASGVIVDSPIEVASVEREVSTLKENRIDLLIDTGSMVVLVENKIFASVNNPFEDYARFLDQPNHAEKEKVKILLTMYPSEEGSEWGFRPVTYDVLIEKIRAALGEHVLEANTKYLTHFLDFLSTIEHFREGTRMDKQLIELFAANEDKVDDFLKSSWNVRDEMRNKVKELLDVLDTEDERIAYSNTWRPQRRLLDVAYVDVKFPDGMQIALDCELRPSGWKFRLFQRYPKKRSLPLLARHLESAGILDGQSVEGGSMYYSEKLSYDEPLPSVAKFVQDRLVDSLLKVSREVRA